MDQDDLKRIQGNGSPKPPKPELERLNYAEILGRLQSSAAKDSDSEVSRKAGLVRALTAQIGERYRPSKVNLACYLVYHPKQTAVLERMKTIANGLSDFVASGSGLVLYGPVGTGKDHLVASLLYLAAGHLGISSRWVSAAEFYAAFRDSITKAVPEAETMQRFFEPAILALSDPLPPEGEATAWNKSLLYRIIDARYRALKPTWMTLNIATIEEGENRLTLPVFDRIRDGGELIHCHWPSYRKSRKHK